jgi:RimJ/RimL family protein N-acetyltransferase
VELTTARLHLRPFTAADHEAIHAVYSDPEVMRYVGHGAHQTMAETANALRIYGEVLALRDGEERVAAATRRSSAAC